MPLLPARKHSPPAPDAATGAVRPADAPGTGRPPPSRPPCPRQPDPRGRSTARPRVLPGRRRLPFRVLHLQAVRERLWRRAQRLGGRPERRLDAVHGRLGAHGRPQARRRSNIRVVRAGHAHPPRYRPLRLSQGRRPEVRAKHPCPQHGRDRRRGLRDAQRRSLRIGPGEHCADRFRVRAARMPSSP